MKNVRILGFLMIGMMLSPLQAAEFALNFIQLHDRQSQEMIPLLQPFLVPNATIVGRGGQLVVRTTQDNFQEIQDIVKKFDTKPRQLVVSITQDSRIVAKHRATDALSTRLDAFNVKTLHTQSKFDDHTSQQLRVLEGRDAWIQVGEQIPTPTITDTFGGGAVGGIRYQPVTTGFFLNATLLGRDVTLTITPHKAQLSPLGRDIQTQSAHSIIRIRLGEWVTLGGDWREQRQHRRAIHTRRTVRRQNEQMIHIKVDESP